MGALWSKGCCDASRIEPLNVVLSHEEAGNRASVVVRMIVARTRNRAGNLQATTTSRARQPTNTRQPAIIAEANSLNA